MPQPKAHKYKKKQRLSKAKAWIEKYDGKKLYHDYSKHFGVNKLFAILELEMLGIEINPQIKESVMRSEEQKRFQSEKRKAEKENEFIESDEYFAYIAGYTSGGAPYGITWEEMEEIQKKENSGIENICIENEDLPF